MSPRHIATVSTGRPNSLELTGVEFGPAARTNWHVHGGVQILFIVAERCWFQHPVSAEQRGG